MTSKWHQNDTKMTSKWHQNDIRMTWKWLLIFLGIYLNILIDPIGKFSKNDLKMTPKWHQNDIKMTVNKFGDLSKYSHRFYWQIQYNWHRNDVKMTTKWRPKHCCHLGVYSAAKSTYWRGWLRPFQMRPPSGGRGNHTVQITNAC